MNDSGQCDIGKGVEGVPKSPDTDRLVEATLDQLRAFPIPAGWDGELFLLPDVCIRILCDHIRRYKIRSVLELGTGFGTTSCVIAACLEELGGGKLITVDRHLHQPINVAKLMDHCGIDRDAVEVVVQPSGYNWVLADALESGLFPGGAMASISVS
jgi:predicted O-methyltransferase YrrM